MKKIILVILAGFVLSPCLYAQTNVLDGVYVKGDSEIINDVNQLREETLSKISSCQKKETYKDEGDYEYVYKKGSELKLITIKTTDGQIEKRVAWYFDKHQLVYVEQTWVNNESNGLIDHEQFYEDNGHLVAMIKNNISVAASSNEFREVDKGLKEYAEKVKK